MIVMVATIIIFAVGGLLGRLDRHLLRGVTAGACATSPTGPGHRRAVPPARSPRTRTVILVPRMDQTTTVWIAPATRAPAL